MTLNIGPWRQGEESFHDYNQRRLDEQKRQADDRRRAELFRLSLTGLKLDRYAFGVEHGMDEDSVWQVHAYVVCVDCYRLQPGLVDPRTIVADSGIKDELDPQNEVLSVGVNMYTVIVSMIEHERARHRPRKAA